MMTSTKNNRIGRMILYIPALLTAACFLGFILAGYYDAEAWKLPLMITALIGLAAFLVLFPMSIYFFHRKEYDPSVYSNLSEEQKKYITGWSWSACLTIWMWAFANKLVADGILGLLPFVNSYECIKLSLDGRKFAWERDKHLGFEKFKAKQVRIARIVVVLWILINGGVAGLQFAALSV